MKSRVKKHFSKSAATYDENAVLQECIGDRLIAGLIDAGLSPRAILDVGAGTARVTAKLSGVYPDAKVFACDIAHGMMKYAKQAGARGAEPLRFVTADMEHLPFSRGSFDIVFSNAAAQWVDDIGKAIGGIKKILTNDGVLCFSTFGTGTLFELKHSFDEAYRYFKITPADHVNAFRPVEEIVIELKRAGFRYIRAEVEARRTYHKDAKGLLRSLKAIGSHRSTAGGRFAGRDFMRKVFDFYESNFCDGAGIYATYMVYYFICGGTVHG